MVWDDWDVDEVIVGIACLGQGDCRIICWGEEEKGDTVLCVGFRNVAGF